MSTDPRLEAVHLLGQVLPAPSVSPAPSQAGKGQARSRRKRRPQQQQDGNQGRSLREVLASRSGSLSDSERGLLQDLCFGVCRHYRLLNHWLGQQMDKPLKASAQPVRLALLAGIYELWFTERPQHAIVNAWPDVCRRLKAPWASGLCNALLRKASREDPQALISQLPAEVGCSVPDWLWHAWQRDWPDQAAQIARASISEPPMTLRCHRRQTERQEYLHRLTDAGIDAHPGELSPWSVYLHRPMPVDKLPGFRDGLVSVQDEAAQLPVELIEVPADARILDACAAPGGKTGQLAERFPRATLLALDNQPGRLERIRENLSRLKAEATLICGDASTPEDWFDDQAFDAILLDAPCSASGILRRQPDSKWHRRESDIAALAGLQSRMLSSLWPLVRPGGMLVYATCSILREENEMVVQGFLQQHPDAAENTPATAGNVAATGVQLLPEEDRQDGFYFARLCKSAH